MSFIPAQVIKKKRDGLSLSREEIDFFVKGYYQDNIPDYQMSALLMALTLKGMTKQEAADLTQSMLRSGQALSFTNTKYVAVDKHSTGGVGDKTSLIIAPIVAACGVPVPMIAGRGLGHTGGTLDKMESIPGYNILMDLSSFKSQVETLGCALIGQTKDICPADKKMYALRDVTATVESIGLICGSILSKKIAEGIQGLVMDVKCGSGAFMKNEKDATELAEWLAETARLNGVETTAYITDMSQPLGLFIGNAIEVLECLSLLENRAVLGFLPESFNDTRELSLILSAEMLILAGRCKTFEEAKELAEKVLTDGSAFEMFRKMIHAQGGDLNAFRFDESQEWAQVLSSEDGFVCSYNTEAIGYAAISLGAGRRISSDQIDHQASIIAHKKIGTPIKKGDLIFSFTQRTPEQNKSAHQFLTESFKISLQKPTMPSLILKRLGG